MLLGIRCQKGVMRWFRDGDKLIVQWKDKRVVTIMTTIHNANESDLVNRKIRIGDKMGKAASETTQGY